MSKVTSKLQVTIPKTIADLYGIRPGDEIEWEPAGALIRIIPPRRQARPVERKERLRLFDEAEARRHAREAAHPLPPAPEADRGWTREELYVRGSAR